MTITKATLSIAQLVFFNTTPKTPNANCTEAPLPVYVYWTQRSLKVQEWRNVGCVSQTWAMCELPPCHVGVPGEEDGIIRDATVRRRGCSFSTWTSSGTIHRWRYRQYRSQCIFNNICRIVFMALVYRCFTHLLPWTKGRRQTYMWFQAVTANLLFLLNIPLSCRRG